MKKILLALLAVCGAFEVLAQSQNSVDSPVEAFKDINVSGEVVVTLVRGENPAIVGHVNNAGTDKLEYFVKDSELFIRLKQPFAVTPTMRSSATVTVTYNELCSITSDGGTILSPGVIEAPVIVITTIGGSNINLNMDTRDVEVESTNSVLNLSGSTEYLNIKAMAGAKINSLEMECDNVNVQAHTTAECHVNAKVRLEAKAATRGRIYYKDDPEIIKVTHKTFGTVKKMQ
ncbi:MAG: DUF2807 domain-containing protein [Rikenellaceae bacterium]|nr:DUF2807 domain-containing protein [Rikenellaceae bacterium]